MCALQIIITVVVLIAIIGPLITLYYSRRINDLDSVEHHPENNNWDDEDDDWGQKP